jgi:hypothetical protein
MEATTTYFDKPGRANTDDVIKLAATRASALGINKVVVATNTLVTAAKALEAFKGGTIIAVTHVTGFTGPDAQEFTPEDKKAFEAKGGIVHTAAHAFGGLQRSLAKEGTYPAPGLSIGDVIAQALRTFGQGTKVCLEIATMAADAGYLRTDEDCIAIGGSGGGADTALVIRPNYTHKFFQSKVREIICKPRQ